MVLSLRAVLVAALAAGFSHLDALAQTPDGTGLPPSATDAVEATPTDAGEPGRDNGMALDAGGATRREILNRLFAGRAVEIEWRNQAFADGRVTGPLRGPPAELARRLLERVSYMMFYDASGDEPRLARIVILGSDPPSVTRSAGMLSPARQEVRASEAARKREAIETARRAISAAQGR